MTFPWNLQGVFQISSCSIQIQMALWLSLLEEALEMLLLAIPRAFLQADPLQLSIQQPFKSDTEPQQAFPAFLELASDEELCSLDLERLLSSFWQASLVEIWVGTDLEIMMGDKGKVLDKLRTSIQASCNGLRAAILGERWELVHVGMSPVYPDGVCCAWRWDNRLLPTLDNHSSRALSLWSPWTSLPDWA